MRISGRVFRCSLVAFSRWTLGKTVWNFFTERKGNFLRNTHRQHLGANKHYGIRGVFGAKQSGGAESLSSIFEGIIYVLKQTYGNN